MNTFQHLSMATASAIMLAYATVTPAQAAQLGTADLDISGSILAPNAIRGNVGVRLFISDDPRVPSPFVPLQINLQNTIITPSDIGRTFTFTSAQETNFNNFTSLLTDERRSVVGVTVNFLNDNNLPAGFGIGLNESSFSGARIGAVDFSGNTIDTLDLRINSFEISNTTTASTISIVTTLTVNGQPVPEPNSTIGMLVIAVLGISYKLKRLKGNFSLFTQQHTARALD